MAQVDLERPWWWCYVSFRTGSATTGGQVDHASQEYDRGGNCTGAHLYSLCTVQHPPLSLLAAMKDRASVNGVPMRTLRIVYTVAVDIGCFSHSLDLVRERLKVLVLTEFITSWVSLFAHSPKARLCWKERMGIAVRSYCPTRWWSQWEVIKQAMDLFGDIEPFLASVDDFSTATRTKLLAIDE